MLKIDKEKREIAEEQVKQAMPFVVMLKEADTFIAWSPILDETGEGDTEAEAIDSLQEAIRLRLQDKNMPLVKDIQLRGIIYANVRMEPVTAHAEAISEAVKSYT